MNNPKKPSQSKVPKFGALESEEDMGKTVRFDRIRKGNPGGPITKSYDDIQTNKTKPNKKQPNNPKPPKKQPYKPKPKKKQPEFGARKDGKEKVRHPHPLKATTLTSEPALADGYTAAYSHTTKSKGINWKSHQKPPSGPRTKQTKLCGCFPRLF